MFFGPRDPSSALGMYSPLYFITLFIFLLITFTGLYFSKNMKEKEVKKTIMIIGIFLWITEFGKMIFTRIRYGIEDVEWLPLYFCSMFMYACIMTCLKNKTIQNTAYTYMSMGGIVGAIAFFCYPDACIPNYPLFHYMTLRTFIFHSLMIYVGLLILITKVYKPMIKDFIPYSIFMIITFVLAYSYNCIFDKNLMYISKPLDIELSQIIYNFSNILYPFIFGIALLTVPYFVSFGIYKLISYFINKKNSKSI